MVSLLMFLKNLLFPKSAPKPKPDDAPKSVPVDSVNFSAKDRVSQTLSKDGIKSVAEYLGVSVPVVKAVIDVESAGSGYFNDGRMKILFEAHIFSRETNGRYNSSHPDISSSKWDRSLYVGGTGEYDRLQKAMNLNKEAALKSASYGLFQIMGFNYKICDFDSVRDYVEFSALSADNQLQCFSKFVENNGLTRYLRDRNWREFARRYNGPGYAKNGYHTKLERAYHKHG